MWLAMLFGVFFLALVFRPSRAIVAREPILFVSLLICSVPGHYLGLLLQQEGGKDIRGTWWAVPVGIVIGATALGPGLSAWIKSLWR